jgi:uncharacterized membrane protein
MKNKTNTLEKKEDKSTEIKENEKLKGIQKLSIKKSQLIYSGPLPPPEILEKYKIIYEEAPKIIFKVFEKEQENRYKVIKFGQWSALIIGITGLISTTILGIYGNAWLAGGIGFLSLSSLVGAFLYNKNLYNKKTNK